MLLAHVSESKAGMFSLQESAHSRDTRLGESVALQARLRWQERLGQEVHEHGILASFPLLCELAHELVELNGRAFLVRPEVATSPRAVVRFDVCDVLTGRQTVEPGLSPMLERDDELASLLRHGTGPSVLTQKRSPYYGQARMVTGSERFRDWPKIDPKGSAVGHFRDCTEAGRLGLPSAARGGKSHAYWVYGTRSVHEAWYRYGDSNPGLMAENHLS